MPSRKIIVTTSSDEDAERVTGLNDENLHVISHPSGLYSGYAGHECCSEEEFGVDLQRLMGLVRRERAESVVFGVFEPAIPFNLLRAAQFLLDQTAVKSVFMFMARKPLPFGLEISGVALTRIGQVPLLYVRFLHDESRWNKIIRHIRSQIGELKASDESIASTA